MRIDFHVTGEERKRLVRAISEILELPLVYQGVPSCAYRVGDYLIDRNGTLVGEDRTELLNALAARGFSREQPEAEDSIKPNRLAIEFPLEGFTPESRMNLEKLVESKAVLIKKVLGVDELPIDETDDALSFPWFPTDLDAETIAAHTQFICALCKTAKEKKRVNARPQETFENERFAMRVWLIGLGLVGTEYKLTRKLYSRNLTGDSGWRYGKPEREPAEPEREAKA